MIDSFEFLALVLNTLDEHIAVIDQNGRIVYVNHSWETFAHNNACLTSQWNHVNYLEICDRAATMGDEFGLKAASSIRKVINREQASSYFEYPCHSPDKKRWFMMRVLPLTFQQTRYFSITHETITERKLAEEKVMNLSRIDGLTNIANRRTFDRFIKDEWNRCKRLKQPLSLLLLDIDYFKRLNDYYGHLAGDECLKKLAKVISKFAKRPSDICARFGGEEFAIVFGNTESEIALTMSNKILDAIRGLKIPNKNASISDTVTASAGLFTVYPHQENDNEKRLIKLTDALLYKAKSQGRDQVVCEKIMHLPL